MAQGSLPLIETTTPTVSKMNAASAKRNGVCQPRACLQIGQDEDGAPDPSPTIPRHIQGISLKSVGCTPIARSVVAFLTHFALIDPLDPGSFERMPSRISAGTDPLGTEMVARNPALPGCIAVEGVIPVITEYVNETARQLAYAPTTIHNAMHLYPTTRNHRDTLTPDATSTPGNGTAGDADGPWIPQSPAAWVGRTARRSGLASDLRQDCVLASRAAAFPHPAQIYSWACRCILLAFDFSKAVGNDNSEKTGTDRPVISPSILAKSSEYALTIALFAAVWFHYADRPSSEPITAAWCSWHNDRVPGAREPPIPLPPWVGARRPLYVANTKLGVAATVATFATRALKNLKPTGYRASFAEFYSVNALRSGVAFVTHDGGVVTDIVVVLQTAAQVANMVYDAETGDQRGCSIFTDGERGKALAARFLAAARWHLLCAPTATGLAIMASGLYSYASQRHGAAYWARVRPKLLRAKERGRTPSALFHPPVCTPSFWYNGAQHDAPPPPLREVRCAHAPPPAFESPLTDFIDVLNAITEYRTYDEWRARVDAAVEGVVLWLGEMERNGLNDQMLAAAAGAASRFIDLTSSVLIAVLDD
ncbi:hypothetical protein PCL_02037 [Purpureocillium lilacinum]|uniref:Uncharacterized protein n=1 Tax=Purpureocillium lilacinum TaxID=33203 RepID=A0A2U3E186_PURLI|nr:hypothetical protein PCL_02037 [Purpureocillium lilacinum]